MTAAPPLKALTVRQPWAFAIAEGFKTIENRTRRTHHRGEVLLHTSRQLDGGVSIVRYSRDAARRLDQLGGRANFWDAADAVPSRMFTNPPTLALTGIIGTVRITGCHQAGDDCLPACEVWGEPGTWHWELADARPLPAAVPVKGALGLWTPDEDVQQAVRDQQAKVLRYAADMLCDGVDPDPNLAAEYPDIDGAVATVMVAAAVALEHGAVLMDTPRLLTEAYRWHFAMLADTARGTTPSGPAPAEAVSATGGPSAGPAPVSAENLASCPPVLNPADPYAHRRALVFNALTRALTGERNHVRLSARDRAARAVLDELAHELAVSCPTPETHNYGCPCDFRETADRLEACNPHLNDDFAEGVAWALAQLRRQADHTDRAAAPATTTADGTSPGPTGTAGGAARAESADARIRRLEDLVDRLGQTEQRQRSTLDRIRQMADAWEEQLPDVIRTATAVDAIRTTLTPAATGPTRAPETATTGGEG